MLKKHDKEPVMEKMMNGTKQMKGNSLESKGFLLSKLKSRHPPLGLGLIEMFKDARKELPKLVKVLRGMISKQETFFIVITRIKLWTKDVRK